MSSSCNEEIVNSFGNEEDQAAATSVATPPLGGSSDGRGDGDDDRGVTLGAWSGGALVAAITAYELGTK